MRKWAITSLFAVASTVVGVAIAHADPSTDQPSAGTSTAEPRNYVVLGAGIGGLTYLEETATLSLDVAHRDEQRGVWWRVAIVGGMTSNIDEGNGSIFEARAGVEWMRRDCTPGCGYAGVDLAFLQGHMQSEPDAWHVTGALAIPRAGVDFGGRIVRFRVNLEVPLGAGQVHSFEPSMAIDVTKLQFIDGFTFSASVGVAF